MPGALGAGSVIRVVMRLNLMRMRTRSILSSLFFAAGMLCVCLSREWFLSLSFPGGGFLPLLAFMGLIYFAGYIRNQPPSFRAIVHSTPADWLVGIPLAACLLAGYIYHILWLQVLVLIIVVAGQLRRDFAAIRDYDANHAT